MKPRFVVSPWGLSFAFHEIPPDRAEEIVRRLHQSATLAETEETRWRSLSRSARIEVRESFILDLHGFRLKPGEAMWIGRQILGLTDPDSMTGRIVSALDRRTNAFRDELLLHKQIHQALAAAGIPHSQEVPIPEAGRIDFIAWECVAIEVKARSGGGRSPLRQLFRYLEDPRFELGILISTRRIEMPISTYEAADGRKVPLRKIELWKNAL